MKKTKHTCTEQNWNSKKEILKMRFPVLNDADLHSPGEGNNNSMLEKLALRLGLTADELGIVILTS